MRYFIDTFSNHDGYAVYDHHKNDELIKAYIGESGTSAGQSAYNNAQSLCKTLNQIEECLKGVK